tara:strand:+ start:1328 stop:1477 length:150 start_codon:yes stop_codon:yes gene_type:complete
MKKGGIAMPIVVGVLIGIVATIAAKKVAMKIQTTSAYHIAEFILKQDRS